MIDVRELAHEELRLLVRALPLHRFGAGREGSTYAVTWDGATPSATSTSRGATRS